MPQFQPDRALEIVAPKYGTAYRIGGRLLLTCRHLFDNSNNCKVRFRSASNYSDKQDIDAKVIWKAPDNIDIALVELPETIETCDPVGFGVLPDASSTQKVKFDCLGFPLFLRYAEDDKKYATGLHIEGIIDVANRAPNNRLVLNIKDSPDIQPTDKQLERLEENQSPWQGTSGSAIVCYGLVIGVQSRHPIRDRPASLEAESLARVYDNPEWREILEKHDIDPEPKPVISVNLNTRSYRNQAPLKPSYFVERPEVSIKLKELLLSEETAKTGTLVISAIYGLGGIGKSTLAAALAQDQAVQAYFPDGIFWATLGQQPDILSFLYGWIQALGDYDFKPMSVDAASLQLRTLLADKKALLVVDDLWNVGDIEPFQIAGNNCKLLVTTREVPVKGATPYNLDVMTETQSLALLTGYLRHELIQEERKQAKILAKIVGYLPLALELTAAQVKDGITWDELLEDLQAEIAYLEILDRADAEDTPHEEKRKHYSLIASFNLSLKRLKSARLRQFIWLGVLPDDVTITEKMAATLWDCQVKEARETLRYLRGKALLLTGVSSEQITNYRVHDLLHDLARNLLQASSHPQADYQLPGLGLSITEAHQQLLSRYQKQIKRSPLTPLFKGGNEVKVPLSKGGNEVKVPLSKGDLGGSNWHSLEDDGYIYNHLLGHLEKAQQIAQIHLLLREETAEGHNGWYSQCEKEGKTAVFIKDIARAWQLAEEHFIENPTKSIGLQVRYALITTSLNSLAGNIPAELMALLIQHEIWTPAQGLAYVRQNQDDEKRAAGLRLITPYLPPTLLPEALAVAKAIGDEDYRAEALTGLAPYLPEILSEALEIARGIGDERYRAEALTGLAPHLPEVLPEALEVVRAIGKEKYRAKALTGLAPHLPESLLPESLKFARAIRDEYYCAEALTGLAPHLPESLLPESLKVARAIRDEYYRAKALTGLAPHLPESLLPESLKVARAIRDEYYRAKALTGLAPYLPKSLLPEALEIARAIENEYWRAKALTGLAHHLPEVLPEVLELARAIGDKFYYAVVFESSLPEAIGDKYSRAEALRGLATHFPEVLPEALKVARAIGDKSDRAEVLRGLATHFPEVLPEALELARAIGDTYYRAEALRGLATHFPEVLPEALEIARAIRDKSDRIKALRGLAHHLPKSLLPEALEVARAIGDKYYYYYGEALRGLAPYLPEVLPEALELARAIWEWEYSRAEVLRGLAPYLPKSLLPEALEVARGIENENSRAWLLRGLAPYLPKSLLPEALEVARGIENKYSRAEVLTGLAPHLPESLLPESLKVARAIRDEYYRAKALTGLAHHLPEVLPEALEVARAIGYEYRRVEALTGLAHHLPEVLPEALEVARAIGYESNRAWLLTGLAPYLPKSLLPEALEVARGIENKYSRAEALTGLAPYFPEVLPEALEVARAIRDKSDRIKALRGLAHHLPEVLPEALEVARAIGDEKYRARVLTELAPYFPESLLPEALESAKATGDEDERTGLLRRLTRGLTPANVDQSFWENTLHALGTLTRPNFLETIPNLVPLILHFGGEVALREVYQAIREVSRWWK
ncbi:MULTISPECIES: NB-ARC domain-containing protein [unclassified Microcystis]|uniref:NB-ARC domain-containing protein n=1 Tax=unclassified Microcystis TaxID=2643300 RepID=UPI00258D459A|nr:MULTISPECIES: NB-ARC domain-containing protein [unclassified Microcystis]MCA2671149.1 trypsin-like serine protease [Microcystis sp. M080S2]MCA2737975.1 trypsin-like serine protease [Microcystis sp. M165S2]MCA2762682.1 trypsin-like serine protease [Microcystis sp. M151S2]